MGGLVFGAQGVSPTLRGQPTNVYALQAGQTQLIPAGNWGARPGKYSVVQQYDPIAGFWRAIGGDYPGASHLKVESDGVNWRFVNQTGCMVGAIVTAAGSGFTSAPTVTPSGGNSVWQAIIGGVVSGAVTVTNGGTNYVYPPLVQFSAPGNPGVQATGYATLSGSTVLSITVVDSGAGYTSAPVITLTNDPRDTTGSGAAATCVLTGAGTLSAVICTDHGNPTTSLPTLAISGGGGTGAQAIAIGNYTLTAYTVSTAGSGYSGTVEISGLGGFTSSSPIYTNPTVQANLTRVRKASILGVLSSGALTATGQVVYDGGVGYPNTPTGIIYGGFGAVANSGAVFGAGAVSFTVGGATDVVELFPA